MIENFYPNLVSFHGLFSWFVLAAAIAATVVAFSGWCGTKPPGASLLRMAIVYVVAMDVELITGVLLYLEGNASMRSAFIGHGILMLFAVLLAHVGAALTRKASSDVMKYRGAAIAWTLSLLVMLAGIPRH